MMTSPTHGTRNTYNWHRCRCELCVKANTDYTRKRNQRQARELKRLRKAAGVKP
jgi:hypothetical protein